MVEHPGRDEPRTLEQLLGQSADGRRLRRVPHLVRRAFTITRDSAGRDFWVSVALQLATGVGFAGFLFVGRWLASLVLGGDRVDLASTWPALLALAGVGAVMAATSAAAKEQQRVVGELVGWHAADQVLDVTTSVELVAYDRPAFHDRAERARLNALVRPAAMTNGLLGLLSTGIDVAGVAVLLLVIEPLLAVLLALAVLPGLAAGRRATRINHDFETRQTPRTRESNWLYLVLSRKEEAAEVRANGLAPDLRSRHRALMEQRVDDLRGVAASRRRLALVGAVLAALLTAVALATSLWLAQQGRIPLADAATAFGAILLASQRLRTLVGSTTAILESAWFLEDFTEFVDVDVHDGAHHASPPARRRRDLPRRPDVVRAEGITFAYPASDGPVLHDVTIEVRRGEVTALVGLNGSGKTTLAKILAGLYRPDAGTVVWDGHVVDDADLPHVRDSVALVPQRFMHLQLSLRDNVRAGRFEHDDPERVDAAIRAAGLTGLVARLPEGLDTRLGPAFSGGHDLSGGEWQRVALARAFYRDAPLLVMDEPTASLDPRAEARVFDRASALQQGRGVLLITHRLSSVRDADRIHVLGDGRVVEQGTHDALLAAGGHYAELFRLQADAYLEDRGAHVGAAEHA